MGKVLATRRNLLADAKAHLREWTGVRKFLLCNLLVIGNLSHLQAVRNSQPRVGNWPVATSTLRSAIIRRSSASYLPRSIASISYVARGKNRLKWIFVKFGIMGGSTQPMICEIARKQTEGVLQLVQAYIKLSSGNSSAPSVGRCPFRYCKNPRRW